MKITKIGHCCLYIEIQHISFLTDPGAWTTDQNTLKNIDAILITHEHPDHLHLDSVKILRRNNPQANIFTNRGVAKILEKEHIPFQLLEHGECRYFHNISLEAFGEKHAFIAKDVQQVINTGYLFAERFFYGGDAFFIPPKSVEILALPVCGPWMKIADALEYLEKIRPQKAFPVHDGMLKIFGGFYDHPRRVLKTLGGEFLVPKPHQPMVFS